VRQHEAVQPGQLLFRLDSAPYRYALEVAEAHLADVRRQIEALRASYRAAQIPFVFVSALLAPLSYWTAHSLTGQRWHGWLAGLLAIFSGFYFPFWTAIDNFAPFAIAGSLALLLAWRGMGGGTKGPQAGATDPDPTSPPASGQTGPDWLWFLAAGACTGLAHLARADWYRQQGRRAEALADIAAALDLAARTGMRLFACDAHLARAQLALGQDQPEPARFHLDQAAALIEATGYRRREKDVADLQAALKG